MNDHSNTAAPHADLPGPRPPISASPLPGADSLAWKYVGQWRMMTVLGRALVLETAHPVVGAGVAEFSTYRNHPWRRAQQTLLSLQRIVYLDTRAREKEAARLTRLHRHINGVDTNGCPYNALDQEAMAWVHLSVFDAMVVMCRAAGRPLTPRQEEQLYGEWCAYGRVVGLGEDAMPATVSDFWAYFARMTRERITDTQGLRDLRAALTGPVPPPAQLSFLPAPLWRALSTAGARAFLQITAALLTPQEREQLNMPATRTGSMLATVVCRAAAVFDGIAPVRLRYMPIAAKAITTERRLAASLKRKSTRPAANTPELFHRILDQSGDGFIAWADLAAVARVVTTRLDLDEAAETALYDSFHTWWQHLRTTSDTDGDGRLNSQEYAATDPNDSALLAAMESIAAAVDRDGDGHIDQAEYTHLLGGGARPEEVLQSFRHLDADGDGRVTVAEFAAALGEVFLGKTDSPVSRHLLGQA